MTDFNEPTNSTVYTSVLSTLRSEIASVAKMDFSGDTNLPTNTLRLTTSTGLVESWNGSAWVVQGYIWKSSTTGTCKFASAVYIGSNNNATFGGSTTNGSTPVTIYGGSLNSGALSGQYGGFKFSLDPAITTYNYLEMDCLNGNAFTFYMARQGSTGGSFSIGTIGLDDLIFVTNGGNRGRIDSNGYLLMGYTSSNGAYLLQVNSQIFATNATIATSDGRYKEDVKEVENALDLVSALKPVSFKWKKHPVHNFPKERDIGFIAQDVREVLKNTSYSESVVKGNETTLPDGEKEEFLGLADSKLVPLLVGAIKELKAKNDALEARLTALEASIS